MGIEYAQMGRYAEALVAFEASLRIKREMGDVLAEANTRRGMAEIYKDTGRLAEATAALEECLQVCQRVGAKSDEISARGTLASAYSAAGKDAEALVHYETCLRLSRELGERSSEAQALGNLGVFYKKIGRTDAARSSYDASLKIDRELGNQRGEAIDLLNLGVIDHEAHRYDEALKNYTQGLAIAERIGAPEAAKNAHMNIGVVHQWRKEWPQAVAEYRRAIELIERVRGLTREKTLQTGFLQKHIAVYYCLADCLQQMNEPAETFVVSERAKARALVDLLAGGKADVRKAMTEAERREEQRLEADQTALAVQLRDLQTRPGREPAEVEALKRRLDQARTAHDTFRRNLFLAHPELETQRAEFAPATLVELNRTLFAAAPDLAVLSYLIGDNHVLLFVLTRGDSPQGPARLRVQRVSLDTQELRDEVDAFRRSCLRPAGGAPDAEKLFGWLLAPAAEALAGAKHVVIVPDGVLHTLPFQALRDADGKYLVERLSVSYAPSVTALVKMAALAEERRRDRGAGAADVLAVGRPAFGGGLKDLPASETEAKSIAGLFGGRALTLLGPKADKAAVLAALGSARYVHLATHGLLNEASPMYSAVALTPAPGRDDGLLYARELLDQNLRAELVVLSACETALGQRVGGEGVLGLAWSLFVAGAPSTVVSQWSVADESTGALMAEFHTRLAAGVPKAEALRQAQLKLLGDRPTRHPFFWAPFVLIGDWGA